MRCSSRLDPFGAPPLVTRSTAPPSMPRSSEGGGAHTPAPPPCRHRVLDLAPLRHVERAVVERDREPVLVDAPQLLKNHFRLHAGVDEHERGLVAGGPGLNI